MNSGYVVVQKIVALLQGEVDTDAADHFAPAEAFAMKPLAAEHLAAKHCAER